MGYYIRVLGVKNLDIHLDEIIDSLKKENLSASLSILENEDASNWTVIQVTNNSGEILSQIEKNLVVEGDLGAEELEEFDEFIEDNYPKSAVNWLKNYFEEVKIIYAFQLFEPSLKDNNYTIVNFIQSFIWNRIGGILQSDGEGFTNEEGYHIIWQFDENVEGEWQMAVLNEAGVWEKFIMDLAEHEQREEFFKGKVPKGAKRIH